MAKTIGMINLKPKNINRKSKKRPYRSKNILICDALRGKRANKTFEPSSGGKGTKLNTPSIIFTKIIMIKN